MSVARHLSWPDQSSSLTVSIAKASFDYYSSFDSDDHLNNNVPDDHSMWARFFLHPPLCTPPSSPQRDEEDSLLAEDPDSLTPFSLMPTSELFECEQTTEAFRDPVLQDCMWSGAERRTKRVRNVSLSELSMVTTSTSCIDPTTFTAYPRQHNQVEHNYSLATPEPMRMPKPYYHTPSTSENSESEEDVIDVVTVDSLGSAVQASLQPKSNPRASVFQVRHNLEEVAERLSSHPYKRPKCMTADISNKKKTFMSSCSLPDSYSGSDCEEYGVKRSAHNVMERKRRSELRHYLHQLRDQLPMTSDRPAKVQILERAKATVMQMGAEARRLSQLMKAERERNAKLQQRLSDIRMQKGFNF